MDTIEMARAAGLVVLLDARIGQQTYHTVTGSLAALERFEALCRRTPVPDDRCADAGIEMAGH